MMNIAYKYIKDKNLDDVHLFHSGGKKDIFFATEIVFSRIFFYM